MKYGIIFFFLCPLVAIGVENSKTTQALLNEGNHAYGEKQYIKALDYYKQAIKTGHISPDLYYNLAQVHWKLQQKGPALFFFKKATTLSPFWKQASQNINHICREIGLSAEKPLSVLKKIPLNWWTLLLLFFFWLAAFFIIKIIFSVLWRWVFALLSLGCLLVAIVFGSILWFCAEDLKTVIVLESTPLKFSPTAQSPQRQTIKEGTFCKLIDQKGNYLFVEALSNGQKFEGWLEKDKAGILYEKN